MLPPLATQVWLAGWWQEKAGMQQLQRPRLPPLTTVLSSSPFEDSTVTAGAANDATTRFGADTLERLSAVHVHVALGKKVAWRAGVMGSGSIVVCRRRRGAERERGPRGRRARTERERHGCWCKMSLGWVVGEATPKRMGDGNKEDRGVAIEWSTKSIPSLLWVRSAKYESVSLMATIGSHELRWRVVRAGPWALAEPGLSTGVWSSASERCHCSTLGNDGVDQGDWRTGGERG